MMPALVKRLLWYALMAAALALIGLFNIVGS
jgi:hypothetical protein